MELLEKREKLEKERLENEKKEKEKKEKEEKERLKKEQEKLKKEQEKIRKEQEKIRKEQEKIHAKEEKERREKEKKLQKEREKEIQRQKELEPFLSPPYGIHNYGNTCYFNSVNQIFLNLPILQQLFLDPKIIYFINRTNKFGHQGKFFDIYKSLYWIKYSKVGDTVKSLKQLVGKLKEDFNNNQQQDANEYLNFVLESLHEELNMHSSKIYIEEKDDIFNHNTVDEMGEFSWSNNLKRNTSFIDSVFMFQLKSNLKCIKCKNKKYNFETNYIFDLPLSLCKMVTIEVFLYRLPFRYKVYFDIINTNFKNYLEKNENKNKNYSQNLWNYYSNVLTIEEKQQHVIELHFSFDLERDKKMFDITKILRAIKPLELEPENITEIFSNEKITEYKFNQLTDFITYSKEKKKIIYPSSEIDKFVNIEDKIILNIYEVLNTHGMKKLFEEITHMNFQPNSEGDNKILPSVNKNKSEKNEIINIRENLNNLNENIDNKDQEIILYSYLYKKNFSGNVDDYLNSLVGTNYVEKKDNKDNNIDNIINDVNNIINNNIINEEENKSKKIKILSLNEKMIIFPKEEINSETKESRKIICEFAIPIVHYWRSIKKSSYLFRNFYHVKIEEFPIQYVILNNNYDLTARQLYEYVWNLNTIYMNHPNIDTSNFWWNQENKNIDNEGILQEKKYNKNTNIKNCYPFVLRYSEVSENDDNINNHLIQCPLCIWYRFCPGCIINPNGDLTKFTSKFGIVVDWCYSFVIQEFQNFNFRLVKEIDNQVISENFPIFDKDQNYQSINDCFNLFFEEEKLEDPLFCPNCKGPENFTKCYSINRLPYVLILSLKRFKLNQNSNFKLRKMIIYPLYDLEIGNDKVKEKYDLYGIVNHYGSINSGHYTAFIKKGKQWILCNDSQVGPIEENKVMHANAYILFYICQESPYKNDYFKYMKSIMNKIIIKDKKEVIFQRDNNFFKGEPVITKYGEGYVIKENLVDFKCDDNYDIYTELKNEDKLRIENLNKKHKKDEKKNKEEKKDDKKEKNKKGPKDEKDDKKDEKKNKEENKDNKKEENKDEQKNIKEDNKQDDKKEEEKDIKKEGKLEEVKEENKEEKNNLKDDDKNDKQENKEEIKEGKNKENKEGQKEDKNEDKNKENQKDNINEEKNGDKKIEIKEEQNYIKNEADNEEQKEEKNKEINNDQNNKCDEKNEEQKKIKNEELNEEQKDNKIDKKNKDKNKDINEEKNDSKKEEQNEERTSDKIDENNEKENKDKNEEQNEGYKDEKNEEKNNDDINKEQKDKKEKEKNGQQNDKYEEQTNDEKNSEIKEEQIADKNEEKGKGKEIEINIDKKENENKIEKKKYSGINKEIVNKNEDDEEKEKIFQEDENNKSDINNENKNEKKVNEDNKKNYRK